MNLPAGPLRAYEALRATRDDKRLKDVAMLVARIGLAWVFIWHGAHTLFSAFTVEGTSGGIHHQAVYFATTAHLPIATFFAWVSGIIEFFGGIAVGVGFFGRIAASALVGDMVMAMVTVTFAHGIVGNSNGSGYELNIALAALAFVVFLMGTGRLSLDQALRQVMAGREAASGAPAPPPAVVSQPVG